MKTSRIHEGALASLSLSWLVLLLCVAPASGQLFTNLQAYGNRLVVGDPAVKATNSLDGPKGIATADFSGDGKDDLAVANTDGTVTLYYGLGQGKFTAPRHLQTGAQELRSIVAADFTGDGRPDIAVAAPYAGTVFLFVNQNGAFGTPLALTTWPGARNLAAGDFDGDGAMDLVVAGTTNGLRQLRGVGGGEFRTVTTLTSLGTNNYDFPKPVYSLGVFRSAGGTKDELVVTHADSSLVWILAAGADGELAVTGTFTNQRIHALDVGAITQPASSGALDLVTASRDLGVIEVHRSAAGPARFEQAVSQRIQVPGGPRAVQITDLDNDGWNDLVVVLRNFDRTITYHNSNGLLVAATEMPVGRSPRELVAARFNADASPDVAVMNRDSADVSVLLTYPGLAGFTALDEIYPVDGEVTGLNVFDFNGDGRDDVIQLHRASGEISVRLASTNGLLGPPTFYTMGSLPSAQATTDVNNDGIPDIVTANLGRYGIEPGSVSVRLGDGHGSFGPEKRYSLPPDFMGSLFSLVAADFDNDGNIDLAAGFYDCRLAFFKGHGDGGFTFTHSHFFVYEARVMVAGDFDNDGDIDLAGAGYAGDVVVIENKGDLLTTDTLTRHDYRRTSDKKFGTRDIVAADVNNDGDLDLLVGSGDGTMLFLGAEGINFIRASDKLAGTDFPVSAVSLGDFDGDGRRDLAVSCRVLACISILTATTNGLYQPAFSIDVPAGEFLASGDLDGDGHPDLVGSGSVLWTALSSRRAQPVAPSMPTMTRTPSGGPVINELLAINSDLPLEQDGNRTSDWLEIFNGATNSLPLNGWKLRLTQTNGTLSNEYAFPATAFLPAKGRLLLVCSETQRSLYHTGFKLPGEGGTLTLVNAAGTELDRVTYPAQQVNVSFGRFQDGLPAWTFNPYPSPGQPNTDNGSVEPVVKLQDIDFTALRPGEPIRFSATGRDDVGLISLSLLWQRLDVPDTNVNRVQLYDDGMHDDGGLLDGQFAGLLEPGLPAGAEIQFYLEATDLSGQTVILPDEPVFAQRGSAVTLFSLAVGALRPPLEISELVADNVTGLRDESGALPDWVEIRNVSANPVSLRGVTVAREFFGSSSRYTFGDSDRLLPGEHRVLYCDGRTGAGGLHAPFTLSRSGGQLVLTGVASNGARLLIDSVAFGPQAPDAAWARLGSGGPWRTSAPTPRAANVPGAWLGLVSSNRLNFILAFPTTTNGIYTVEFKDSLSAPAWSALPPVAGDGIEKTVVQPMTDQRFFRVRRDN